MTVSFVFVFFFFQAEDGIRDLTVTGVQTCALPISGPGSVDGSRNTQGRVRDLVGGPDLQRPETDLAGISALGRRDSKGSQNNRKVKDTERANNPARLLHDHLSPDQAIRSQALSAYYGL